MSFIKNLLLMLRHKKRHGNVPILLFEIGPLQVFHFPTPEELTKNSMPSEVFWQSIKTRQTFGPFPGIQQAMIHYTKYIATLRPVKDAGNLIQVDFKNRTRV